MGDLVAWPGFLASMHVRRLCSSALHAVDVCPDDAQHPSIDAITARQGFGLSSPGRRTESFDSGGSFGLAFCTGRLSAADDVADLPATMTVGSEDKACCDAQARRECVVCARG